MKSNGWNITKKNNEIWCIKPNIIANSPYESTATDSSSNQFNNTKQESEKQAQNILSHSKYDDYKIKVLNKNYRAREGSDRNAWMSALINSETIREAREKVENLDSSVIRFAIDNKIIATYKVFPEIQEDVTISPEEYIETPETLFALESQLRDFIAKNLHSVPDCKNLKLYQNGVEFYAGVAGRIDILAVDEEGNFVVFELKLANSPDPAIGQLLRYMGWVRKNLANGKTVKGIIVAKKINEKLKYAIEAVTDVALFEYEISFKLERVIS